MIAVELFILITIKNTILQNKTNCFYINFVECLYVYMCKNIFTHGHMYNYLFAYRHDSNYICGYKQFNKYLSIFTNNKHLFTVKPLIYNLFIKIFCVMSLC